MKTKFKFYLLLLLVLILGCGREPTEPTTDNKTQIEKMELDLLALTNNARTENSLATLTMNDKLRSVARAHSEDMRDRDFFSHTNPDGKSPFDRLNDAGITYSTAGENIAYNSGYSDPANQAHNQWMNSPGHKANILNSSYTQIGIGIAGSTDNKTYWFTQVFIRPSSKTPEFYTQRIYKN